MLIYQMHEHHGRHIAYDYNEAKRNTENGWKTVTEEEFYNIGAIIEGESEDNPLSDREKLEIAYIDKFGKKPHHAMKNETIQEKLDE